MTEAANQALAVSVVIPVRNEALYLGACLEAVSAQTLPRRKYEIIVVDNLSDDGSYEIAEKHLALEPGDRLVRYSGSSIGAVRNFGFSLAAGQIVAFLDGDSVPDPAWLDTILDLFEDRPETGCIGFAMKTPGAQATWIERDWHCATEDNRLVGTEVVSWVPSFNLAVRRERFEEVCGFDETLETGEDYDLGHRLAARSKVVRSDRVLVEHLGGTGDLASFFRKERWRGLGTVDLLTAPGMKIKATARLAVPAVYLVALCSLPILVMLGASGHLASWAVIPSLVVVATFPVALALRTGIRSLPTLTRVSFLYSVYLIARAIAPFDALRNSITR